MKKWEYHKDSDLSTRQLENLGEKGWELVSAVYNPKVEWITYIFKKEKL